MGEYLALSQSSILLPRLRFQASRIPSRASIHFFRSSSPPGLCGLARIPSGQRQQKCLFRSIEARDFSHAKSSTFVVESTGEEEIDIQPDTGSGDGFGGSDWGGSEGGKGGGSSGGGGDSDNRDEGKGEGGSEESNTTKKMGMSMSQKLTLGYAALVGVGGLMGYLKSGSNKSLIAGGTSALLLCYVCSELPKRPAFASSVGLGLSAALLGIMGSRFKKSGKMFPAGVVAIVSFIMSGGYIHGIMRTLH